MSQMFEKYKVNSYPDFVENYYSDNGLDKVKPSFENKQSTCFSHELYSNNSFQPECIYSKETNNNSLFQSDSKNSFRSLKYNNLNHNLVEDNYIYGNRKKADSFPFQHYIDNNFSSNNKKVVNKKSVGTENKRIYLDNYMNQNDDQIPKRTINSIRNQFDIQKRDNFNVLSYRPEDYDSDCQKIKGKIIQIFKKQDAVELFIPNKRASSPPASCHSGGKKQEKFRSYQTPTLKFQSFFGSFTKQKHCKINSQTKCASKKKKNQLEDYNIDKLIEIGDNYENKWTPILSFGKKIKSIKNKMRLKNKRCNKNNIIKNIYNNYRKQNNEDENQENNELEISDNKYNTNNNINGIHIHNNDQININNEKDIFSKKYKYHGQISRKRNIIKNAKTYKAINQTKDDAIKNENKEENSAVYKNITINNEKIEESNNSQKKLNNSSSKLKRNSQTANQKISAFSHNKNNINKTKENLNHVHHEIVPQKNTLRRKIELPLNNNTFNYTLNKNISSYTNVNSIIERNKYLNNCKNINVNEENKDKVAQKDKINDNAVEENKQNVKKIPIGEGENYKKYTKANNNCSVNSSINFNSNTNIILNDTNNQIGKKITESSFKTKKYYGYDSYNLEGAINNHSYYESVYSKKKGVQKNHSFGKIN